MLIYIKRILMTRKICQIAKSAKRRCKVSSYKQQVQLFLNQGSATGNLLSARFSKGCSSTKISPLCRPIRFKSLSNTLFWLVQETLIYSKIGHCFNPTEQRSVNKTSLNNQVFKQIKRLQLNKANVLISTWFTSYSNCR